MAELHTPFAARPATLDDADAIAALVNAEDMESIGRPTRNGPDMRIELGMPPLDLQRDSRVLVAPDDTVAGIAVVFDLDPHARIEAWVAVQPALRGRGIGTALAEWIEVRVRESVPLAPPTARVVVTQARYDTDLAAQRLLLTQGYEKVRRWRHMRVELDELPSTPVLPAGVAIRPLDAAHEVAKLAQAEVDIFCDEWGWPGLGASDMQREFQYQIDHDPHYDPRLWLVAVAGDQIVGIAISWPERNEDPLMGYIGDLGVRREWRRRGIATALLRSAFRALRERGMARAALDVDATSLTGANSVYEKAGMRRVREQLVFEKELRPGLDLVTRAGGG